MIRIFGNAALSFLAKLDPKLAEAVTPGGLAYAVSSGASRSCSRFAS